MNFNFKNDLTFLPNLKAKLSIRKRLHNWMSEYNPEGVNGYDVLHIFLFFFGFIGVISLLIYLGYLVTGVVIF